MLDLRIPLTSATVKALKAYLLSTLQQVKASHRVEAAARGLGFRTYAAMLHRVTLGGEMSGAADGSSFASYLGEHGFDVEPIQMYRAAARIVVGAVMDKVPRLSTRGYGFGQPRWNSERKGWGSPQDKYAQFVEDRAEFLSDDGLDQFLLSLALVRRIPATKTVRSGTGSYRLKHIAENMSCATPDGTKLGPHYVASGALIAAALHAGFRMKTCRDHLGYDAINVSFNMLKRAVDDLDCETRPTGAIAQRRAYLATRRHQPRFYV